MNQAQWTSLALKVAWTLVGVLATWRIAHSIVYERGPFGSFLKWRAAIVLGAPARSFAAMSCIVGMLLALPCLSTRLIFAAVAAINTAGSSLLQLYCTRALRQAEKNSRGGWINGLFSHHHAPRSQHIADPIERID